LARQDCGSGRREAQDRLFVEEKRLGLVQGRMRRRSGKPLTCFVAPNTMLDVVARAIARSIFTTKTKLMAKTPLASQIEAPDPDDKNPVLPVHPGVAKTIIYAISLT
jgi:hypothetical protein